MKMRSPLSVRDIEVLLLCSKMEPYCPPSCPDFRASIQMFLQCEMIVEMSGYPGQPSYWRTTPKGDVFVRALRHVSEPVQTWVVEVVMP